MLKLEKIAKTLEVNITLRKRESLFSRPLVKALGFAIALHLIAGLLFQVKPFMIKGSQMILAPVIVDADISLGPETAAIAQWDNEEAFPRHIREPKESKLGLPAFPVTVEKNLYGALDEKVSWKHNPFFSKEQELTERGAYVSKTTKKDPIQVEISGPLAELNLLETNLLDHEKIFKVDYQACYDVRLDVATGTIFWYQPLHSCLHPDLDIQAERIIKNLRFAKNEKNPSMAGEIAINFQASDEP